MGRAPPAAVGSLADQVWGETAAAGVRSRSLSQEPAEVFGGGAMPTTTTGRSCRSENASVVLAICTATLTALSVPGRGPPSR